MKERNSFLNNLIGIKTTINQINERGSNDPADLTFYNENSQAMEPTKFENFIGQDVSKIACGLYHTLILVNQMVFSFGKTDSGAIGRVDRGKEILQIEGLKKIKDISCGEAHSAALDENNELYVWGCFLNLDNKTMRIPKNCLQHEPRHITDHVAKIASCDNCIIIQKENGDIYYYGSLNIYKYALSKPYPINLKLKEIKGESESIPVFESLNASDQNFFGVKNNEIFAFGLYTYNDPYNKRLSASMELDEDTECYPPLLLEKVDNDNDICKVISETKSCDFDQSKFLFLNKNGELYIKGSIMTEIKDNKIYFTDYDFQTIVKKDVKFIACKLDACLCATNNTLYTWGLNNYGELGHNGKVIKKPKAVDFQFNKIIGIYAGAYHIIVLTEDDTINNQKETSQSVGAHLAKSKIKGIRPKKKARIE